MLRALRLPALAATAALLAAGTAQAQMATYCNGTVAANAFFNTVQSNGRSSVVSYFVQLQNRTNQPIPLLMVTFTHNLATDRISGPPPGNRGLQPYQQITVLLGRQALNNPSGQGALSPTDAHGVPQATSVICAAY